jgi:hypothetical protein
MMFKAVKKFLTKLTAPKPLPELSPRVLLIDGLFYDTTKAVHLYTDSHWSYASGRDALYYSAKGTHFTASGKVLFDLRDFRKWCADAHPCVTRDRIQALKAIGIELEEG